MFVTSAYAQTTAPSATEAHEGVAAHGGNEAFPPFDPQFFPSQILWLAITFIAFYVFVKRVLMPQIGSTLEHRRHTIAGNLEEAARMKEEADAAIAAYEQELADARAHAHEIATKARDEARAKAEDDRRKVEASLEAKLADSEKRIASVKASAMKDVGSIAEETAAHIVERLLGGPAPKSDIAAAVKAARE
ncbi:MAG: ATP F0F1 synthase subunit B' [Rhizobiales bacterium 65-79]|jgi:F-type H+-transporting ATPase subunit b|nr:F0F1 ATP synthase subunit B [Hyphomicrobiales bacterium]OJU02022.1 MAG: ATP F0F1 synthase subunit B' [Rhizobiales bacterium 65-79]